jgi:Fic family protein
MENLLSRIAAKKAELDHLRPLSPRALASLDHAHDLELTYTSNAVEGNTLTQVETNLVNEQGITIGGKKLTDHLEAIDHYEAIGYVRELAKQTTPLGEVDVRNLHALVVKRSEPDIAGAYATAGRYVNTDFGRHAFPAPAEIPALMGDFAAWLAGAPPTPETAIVAHRRLVYIHPFNDGNGRTARLLMNLVLLRGGYPPVAVRPEDRLGYIRALQQEQRGEGDVALRGLLYEQLDAALEEYLRALGEARPAPARRSTRAACSRR